MAHAFRQHLLVDYLETNPDQVSAFLLTQLQQALQTTNIDAFIATLQAIFADIPSQLFLPQEAYYHSVVYLVLRLLGFTIQAERMTNVGRIDAVLELADKVYILEFKMTTGQLALDQIRTKKYAQPFLGRDKTVILLGIAFDKTTRNITDWKEAIAL